MNEVHNYVASNIVCVASSVIMNCLGDIGSFILISGPLELYLGSGFFLIRSLSSLMISMEAVLIDVAVMIMPNSQLNDVAPEAILQSSWNKAM